MKQRSARSVIPGEDGGVLRFRRHGGRQPERLPALPAEGDLLPAAETIPAPALPQRGHQVCVRPCVFLAHVSSPSQFSEMFININALAPSSGSGRKD